MADPSHADGDRPALKTDEERIARIAELRDRIDRDRAEIFELIPQCFPEKRGEPQVRGRLNEVVEASGWTRAYVANIRDGKVSGP
ncbi:hypothetical protein [Actinoallomurus sp. CA-142502]|uniref:hypothetical protein n=1 Tax=Actinoallomurus sp. CA-142502 TaxID=3239885 RepID=UPI003D8DBD7B